MAIINATPDSFSDGAVSNLSIPLVLASLRTMLATPHPPHILDIGGMSTRPHSTPCSEAEELERVVPLIRAIRALGEEAAELRSIPISVDTYRPAVARAAVDAGASCINDVRGGREEGMLETMAKLDVPVVLMHSRGDSTSMTTAALQDYSALGGVVAGVRTELGDTVQRALQAGVKRWNIIIDPGLGFAKSHNDNLILLRRVGELTAPGSGMEGITVLVGGSRKGFVGKTIGREVAKERGYGDAGVLAWCVAQGKGVDIVRVHDARATGEVMGMISAIRDAA
jgi:dihydroneopterin aldolase/2-amino-4-hydroxy-6-hydroxymethyldihydropteridine diphosphokinase/dihydropteroate synthase